MAHEGIDWPRTRLRFELTVRRGIPIRFLYQLEHNVDAGLHPDQDPDWRQVARMEHDVDGAHDVRNEGLHLDVYDLNGEKIAQLDGFPEVPINEAPDYCETYLTPYAEYFVSNFTTGWDETIRSDL